MVNIACFPTADMTDKLPDTPAALPSLPRCAASSDYKSFLIIPKLLLLGILTQLLEK